MSLAIQTLSGTSDKESTGLMDPIQSSKMQVAAVEQISGARFPDQLIHDQRIVNSATGDDHNCRNVAAKIEQRMELHRGFAATKLCPREKRQTQVDDRRVKCIDGLHEFQTERFIRVQLTSSRDQYLSEIGVDPPIPHLIRMSQSVARNPTANTHVIPVSYTHLRAH